MNIYVCLDVCVCLVDADRERAGIYVISAYKNLYIDVNICKSVHVDIYVS